VPVLNFIEYMQGKTGYAREGNETTLPSNLRRRNPQNTIPASLK
jgi:hypothetical protein